MYVFSPKISKLIARFREITYKNPMRAALKPVQTLIMQAVDTVLPPRCIITGEIVDRQGMIAPQAWAQLNFIADPKCERCGIPFDFESFEGMTCTACLDRPPSFENARAALKYDDASKDMILGFKHADQTHAVLAFAPWMEKAGANMLKQADYLVPVPLHRWRLFSRRYNQSALIAQALTKHMGVATMVDGLMRIRATEVQGHKKAVERHKNVKKAFAVNPKRSSDIKGKNIVLIDDVYTTGATVKECAKTLIKGGAARVDVLTLARVVRGDLDF